MLLGTDTSVAYLIGENLPFILLAGIPVWIYRRRSINQRPGMVPLIWVASWIGLVLLFAAANGSPH